jgi:hypothetical protein
MGLFSRKTIVQVSSVIYPMGEEPERIPDIVKASVITASLQDNPIQPAIINSIIDGMGVKLRRAFDYARQTYYLGMPTGFPKTFGTKEDPVLNALVREYLERIHVGSAITVYETYVELATDYQTKVRELIRDDYSYDFVDDETTAATGAVDIGASLVLTGPFLDTAHPGEIGYHLVFTNPDTSVEEIDEWYLDSEFTGRDLITQRVIMVFRQDSDLSETYAYAYGGDDPRLNVFLRSLSIPTSGTFPCIVLKKNNVYLDDDAFSGVPWETSDSYVTSEAYCRRLSLDVDTVIANLKDNPDDGDIDFAYIQPGVRINSPNHSVQKYLYNYFHRLYLLYPDNKTNFENWTATNDFDVTTVPSTPNKAKSPPSQSIHIYDPETTTTAVDMEIAWRWITVEAKSGSLATPYEVECGPEQQIISKYTALSAAFTDEIYESTLLKIRKRTSSTTYDEMTICGLRHENYIYKGHSVQSGVWAAFNEDEVEDGNDDGTGFIIPLDYSIFVTLTPRERLQLGQECLHLVLNCYVQYKQKWYETGFFKFILMVIAVIAIAFSWGTATPYVTAAYTSITNTLVAAGLSATVAAAISTIITAVLVVGITKGISMAAKEFGEWAAEKWGPVWGAIAQMAATVALSFGVSQITGIPMFTPDKLANQVMQLSTMLLSSMAAYTEYTYTALQDEIKTWEDYAKANGNPLEEVNRLMEELNAEMSIAQQAILPRPETMDEFLGRTLTSTDGLTHRLTLPIHQMPELTLTPRL